MITKEDIIFPPYSPDEAIGRDKCIVIKPEAAVLPIRCIMYNRPLCIIDGVVIKIAIAQLAWIMRTVPDIYPRVSRRDQPVIVADTVMDIVVMPGRGARVLEQPKAAAFVLIGQTESYL